MHGLSTSRVVYSDCPRPSSAIRYQLTLHWYTTDNHTATHTAQAPAHGTGNSPPDAPSSHRTSHSTYPALIEIRSTKQPPTAPNEANNNRVSDQTQYVNNELTKQKQAATGQQQQVPIHPRISRSQLLHIYSSYNTYIQRSHTLALYTYTHEYCTAPHLTSLSAPSTRQPRDLVRPGGSEVRL